MSNDVEDRRADELVRQAYAGAQESLGMAFEIYRKQLRKAIQLRVHPNIQSREDESDILQEAFIAAAQDLPRFAKLRPVSVFLWFRGHVQQRLHAAHRKHLDRQKRDARREVNLCHANLTSGVDSKSIAGELVGSMASPSQNASRQELRGLIQEILDSMEPLDREIVAMRHFESLKSSEIAGLLGINESTASTRYLRALRKIKDILSANGIERES